MRQSTAIVAAIAALTTTAPRNVVARQGGLAARHAVIMDHAPTWSRNGDWIAFNSNRAGNQDIYIVQPDGSGLRQLTTDGSSETTAHWTADGRIRFTSDRNRKTGYYSVKPDGTDIRPEAADSAASISKDGRFKLIEALDNGALEIFSADQSGRRTRLTQVEHAEEPSFSPNDSLIAYEERGGPRRGTAWIVVMRRDGSEAKRLSLGSSPSWFPDGSRVLFKLPPPADDTLPGRALREQIATVRLDGSDLRRLGLGVHMTMSPNGRQIAFMRSDGGGGARIWVMQPDGSNQRCITCSN